MSDTFISRRSVLRHLTGFAAAAGGSAASWPGFAQPSYPSKPINIVVPYTAGGPTDLTARRLAEQLGKILNTAVMVDNRTGAATLVASEYVARAPKDGYTLLFAPGTTTSANPYLFKKLPYTLDDFAPVSLVSKQPFVLTAAEHIRVKNIAELIAYAKTRPGGVDFGTTGIGSLTHIIGKWIGRTLGINMQEVPYKGTSAAVGDMLGGRLDSQVEGIVSAIPLHKAGKARVVAVMSEERSPALPDVPSFKESGYPDLVAYIWFGLLAPAGTPDDVLEKLRLATVKAAEQPSFRDPMAENGEIAVSSTSRQEYAAHLRREYEAWGRIIKPLNLELQ